MSAETKQCSLCGQTKPVADFSAHPRTRDGLQSQCRSCQAAATIASRRRRGGDREGAYSTASRRAAAWVRKNRPDVWGALLAEAERERGITRGRWERTDAEASA